MNIKASVVIAAAGDSVRMGGIDKQLADIYGASVLARTISVFESSEKVDEIIVVSKPKTLEFIKELIENGAVKKITHMVTGGSTRQQSVFNGIKYVKEDAEYIAVHDGARPLVTVEEVERCIDDAALYGAAALGVKAKDTIKIVDSDGFVIETPNRKNVYHAQTPQIFRASLYRKAMEQAIREQKDYSDDCGMVEATGAKIYISAGSYENIKITTPTDIISVKNVLDGRRDR